MSGQVYFLECAGSIKIGHTGNLKTRIKRFATGNPQPMNLLGTVPGPRMLEKEIHDRLSLHRIHGEWFRDHPDVRDTLAVLQGHEGRAAPLIIVNVTPKTEAPERKYPKDAGVWLEMSFALHHVFDLFLPLAKKDKGMVPLLQAGLDDFFRAGRIAYIDDLEEDEATIAAANRIIMNLSKELSERASKGF